MKLNETIKKNQQVQEFITKLNDTQKQLDTQRAKLQEVKQNLSNDKAVLHDYKQQLSQAVHSTNDTIELKNLNRLIQDVEKDIQVISRMKQQIENAIQILKEDIKSVKEKLFQLLRFIIKSEKKTLEIGEGAELLEKFLNLNQEFVESARAVFSDLGLPRLDIQNVLLHVKGNYRFIEHMSLINASIPVPIEINNAESHKEYYDKKIKKFQRIIRNFGKSKTANKLPEEPKEPKPGLLDKVVNGLQSGLEKVAIKVSSEELNKIFK